MLLSYSVLFEYKDLWYSIEYVCMHFLTGKNVAIESKWLHPMRIKRLHTMYYTKIESQLHATKPSVGRQCFVVSYLCYTSNVTHLEL